MSAQTQLASPAADEARERAAALEELLLARVYLYELFHKLMGAAPDADVLEALLGQAPAEGAGLYAEDDATMRGFAAFLEALAAREDRAALLDAARDEYTRLFVGPGALPAPTWESPYLTKEPTLFQENTLAVRAAYRAHGVEPKRLQRVPDDHVALLCAFMAERARAALTALRAGDVAALAAELRDELAFVRAHLTSWLEAFAQSERRSQTAVLYPQLIEALAAFAAVDATFLTEAAFWVESLDGLALEASEGASLADFEHALAGLASVRPFGSEDYELVPCGRDASLGAA
ncbi:MULTISPECIES: TorD/DmsD family molecular chaperone [Gordonibacter]|uniref:Molecular chaperone TorD family protein n=1 Tax=Gordonibacter faecis TaxID=3047475 RepID=A0ABT7DNS3_9ACTN|nr:MULTISPECIES: molecular chaperone TorD family protein [unclassified Gordonibacter]MDJ1651176.1 molecular chaperone TorD family protein [Gordonibacter sp. KGMB12511]